MYEKLFTLLRRHPRGVAVTLLLALFIGGGVWLWDEKILTESELRDIGANASGKLSDRGLPRDSDPSGVYTAVADQLEIAALWYGEGRVTARGAGIDSVGPPGFGETVYHYSVTQDRGDGQGIITVPDNGPSVCLKLELSSGNRIEAGITDRSECD
ncbi:hypothetical protein [Nocardia thraciensis]